MPTEKHYPVRTDDELHTLIKEVIEGTVEESVQQTLTTLGFNLDDPIEIQKDMAHLREWREGTDAVKRKGLLVVVGTLVAATLSLIWIGFKSVLPPG